MKKIIKSNLMFMLAMTLGISGGVILSKNGMMLPGLILCVSGFIILVLKWKYVDDKEDS